jgi:protein gp37
MKHVFYDLAWNPIRGCSKSTDIGCANCSSINHVKRLDEPKRRLLLESDGIRKANWSGNVIFDFSSLYEPFRHKKPTTFLVCTLGDLFHPKVEYRHIAAILGVMSRCARHRFIVSTKWPDRINQFYEFLTNDQSPPLVEVDWQLLKLEVEIHPDGDQGPVHCSEDYDGDGIATWPLTNLWVGASVSDQDSANLRWNYLSNTALVHRFMAFEPLLERISIEHWATLPDWMLIGGELGVGARACHVEHIRELLKAKTSRCVSSLGSYPIEAEGRKLILRSRSASNPFEWPADVRVQEVPWEE